MKKVYLLFLTVFMISSMQSQTLDCRKAHTGTFEMDGGEVGTVRLVRTENKQTETCESTGYKATYDVVWIDECNYELSNQKIITGQAITMKPTDIVKVHVLKTVGSAITVKLTTNFSDFVAEMEMVKIK